MRLFVTGATGFIGSHFVNHAIAAGHDLVALRRSAESQPRIDLVHEPIWLTKSMAEIDERDLMRADCLVHLAAIGISPRVASWQELLEWNVTVPARLLLTAARAGLTKWVVTGTCAEYGSAGLRHEFIPPDAPLEPTYAYASSKASSSVLFRTIAAEKSARLSYLRVFSVFGEGQHAANLWPTIRQAAFAGDDLPMTAGEQVRDFVSVEQVAATLLEAVADEVEPGIACVRNVGTGQPQTVRTFAEHWWGYWQARGKLQFGALPYRPGEVMRYVPLVEEGRSNRCASER